MTAPETWTMKLLLPALLAFALAACAPSAEQETPPAAAAEPATAAPMAEADPAVATTLPAYHWQLVGARDTDGNDVPALFPREDRPLQLDFSAEDIFVSNTCNRMHGTWRLAGGQFHVGSLASTMMACPDEGLMQLDQYVAKLFAEPAGFTLDAEAATPSLSLATAPGITLVFNGLPTAATRFGGPGTTVFLEVAPDEVPCNDPLRPEAQCLNVREVHFDDSGSRTGEYGEWQVLGQPIEGFTHEPGTRNVLRVQRFEIADPPADGSSLAWVLDLVVVSERIEG